MDLHNTIKTIPIIQYFKLQETGDLRYLLYLNKNQIFDLPEVEINKEFETAYKLLIESLVYINNKEQILLFKYIKANLLKKNDNIHFHNYFRFIKSNYDFFKLDEKIIDIDLHYNELKEKYIDAEFKEKRLFFVLQLEKIAKENDYLDIMLDMELAIKIKLDEYKDSYYKFLLVIEKIKERAKLQKKNKST